MDEAQLEVTKDLVKFKVLETEEACQEWKDQRLEFNGEIWGDISKAKQGGYFTTYSRPAHLAAEAVKEAGEYYNLRVELTAGYIAGFNWKDCH